MLLASLQARTRFRVPALSRSVISPSSVDRLDAILSGSDYGIYRLLLDDRSWSLAQGKHIHEHLVKSKVPVDQVLGERLVKMYLKHNSVVDAAQVFEELPRASTVTWTGMIAAYARNGHSSQAFYFFRRMQLEGEQPNKVTFIAVLNACSYATDVRDFRSVHDRTVELGVEDDVYVGTALVNVFGKYHSLEEACRVFDGLSSRDVVSWNAMLSVYAHHQQWELVLELFCRMQLEGVAANNITFLEVLNSCASIKDLSKARLMRELVLESGLEGANMVGNAMVDMFGKCGSIDEAAETFDRIGDNKDVISWNAALAAHCQNGGFKTGAQLYQRMLLEGVRPGKVTLATLLHSIECLTQGRLVHSQVVEAGLEPDSVIGSALLGMYGRFGMVYEACRSFEAVKDKDIVVWNAVISSLSQTELFEECIVMFRRMQLEGVRPSKVTYASIVNVCSSLSCLDFGRQVNLQLVQSGLGSDLVLGNALLDLYGKCGGLEEAWNVFQALNSGDVVSWTSIISVFSQHGRFDEALRLFKKMVLHGLRPNEVTFVTVICACAGLKDLVEGRKVHGWINEAGYDRSDSEYVGNAVLIFYGECGSLQDVCTNFQRRNKQDITAWNALLTAYVQQERQEETLRVFQQLQLEGTKPDQYTLGALLEACAGLGSLKHTKGIEARMRVHWDFDHDDLLNTSLLKAYSKCGSLKDASRTFERTPKNDVVAWTAMVAVNAQHGQAEEALELFCNMMLSGVMPNDVTMVSVFAACSHSGQIERAYGYYLGLWEDYGVRVTAEHCKCMIDLLGRAGRLFEAERFMTALPFDCDVVMWTTMLSACSVQGDLERGETAAERVLEMDGDSRPAHVMLSNIYKLNVRQALRNKKPAARSLARSLFSLSWYSTASEAATPGSLVPFRWTRVRG